MSSIFSSSDSEPCCLDISDDECPNSPQYASLPIDNTIATNFLSPPQSQCTNILSPPQSQSSSLPNASSIASNLSSVHQSQSSVMSTDNNVAESLSPTSPSRRSSVWDFIVNKPSGLGKTCANCRKTNWFSPSNKFPTSTTNIARHLAKCIGPNWDNKDARLNDRQPTLEQLMESPAQQKIRLQNERGESLIRFIVKRQLAFSVVEDPDCRYLLSSLNWEYKVMCRQTVSENVKKLFKKKQNALKEMLKSADQISLTADIWTSIATSSF
ncbi:hypothetical protein GEMRC1_001438 [Eukaryota sp. GEM-RC1]